MLERGVELVRAAPADWRFATAPSEAGFAAPPAASAALQLRPVLASLDEPLRDVPLVLPATNGRLLTIYTAELRTVASQSLIYVMEAALYHLVALTTWCARECAAHGAIHARLGSDAERVVMRPNAPYFEFEALVTAIVRAFDTLRYSLWRQWGDHGSTPNSYERVVDSLRTCPTSVLNHLSLGASGAYARAKGYRHCIQHYVDIGSASWAMFELRSKVWTVTVRVPDNPDARSSAKWTFTSNLDALSLGWELCSELFCIAAVALGRPSLCGEGE